MKLTRTKKLAVLKRAREIISDPKRWTKGKLRRKIQGEYRYCLLGACEQAAYDLGYAEPGTDAFIEKPHGLGYMIDGELSLRDYSYRTTHYAPQAVNDRSGQKAAVGLLDGYIKELRKPAKKGA